MLLRLSISCRALAATTGLLMCNLNVSSQCNPPEQLPTNYCQTAPLICLQNACYETIQDNFPDCCSGWCEGNYLIHNPQFFEMLATSTTIEIHLDVIGCDDGTGLQGAIIDACPWAQTLTYEDIVECDGDASAGTTMILILDTAIIGQTYWFMIDGYGGALCNYTVSYVSGILNPPLVGELDPDESMAIPNLVCQGYGEITVVASPAIGLAHGYIWITEWNNETIISTLPEITIDITENMPPGIWDICIIPFSGCDTLEELCIPLEVVVVDDGLVEAFHCLNENFDPFVYEGEDYYSSGNYDLFYPEMALAECDSMAVLALTMVGVDAFIELTCSGSDFVLAPIIQEVVPANAIIDWAWYESGSGFEISGDSALHTTEDGCYDLFATIEVPEGECEIWISGSSFCFDGSQYIPSAPVVNSDTTICAQPGVVFEVTNASVGDEINYVWSAPPDVPAFQNDTSVVQMDFSNSAGGEVCVYVTTSCGVSPTSCFNVTVVNPLQVPDITCSSTANSTLFDWNDIPGATDYLISLDNNTPFIISASEYLVQPLSPGTEVHMLLTLPNTGPCPTVMDSITCIAQDCDPPVIVISGLDSVCLNSANNIQLNAQVNGNMGIGTWTGTGITDINTGIFDPVIAGAGIHQITFTTIVNSCPFNVLYPITVFDSIHGDFSLAIETCVNLIEALEYTGNASASATYNYNFDGAIITFGSGAGPYRLYWPAPGLKTITLQVTQNGCVSEIFTRQIRVDRELEPPLITCTTTDSTIVFSFILDPIAFSHDIDPITLQSYQSINNTIVFSGLNPGEEVIIEFITFSGGKCPNRVDTFSCVAKSCPMPVILVDHVNNICLYPGTGIVDLNVNVSGGTSTGTGNWSGPGIVDVMNGRFDPNIAGPGAHQINYQYKDDGCDFNNPITINVYAPPQAIIDNVNLIITCAEPSLILNGSGSLGTPLLYNWSTATGTIIGLTGMPTAEVVDAGSYQLLVTNAISGCMDSTSVTVTNDANIIVCNAGLDKTITCDSTQFVLGGVSTVGPNIIYMWSSVGGNLIGPVNGPTAIVDNPGQYTLMALDTSTGCQAIDIVVVDIDTLLAAIVLNPGDTIDCNTSVSTVTSYLNEPVLDYTYNWTTLDGNISGMTDGPNVNVQQGGTYTLTIHNKRNGCETSADVFVTESDEIIDAVDVTQRNVRCFGEGNAALIINAVTGGTAPYHFVWNVSSASSDSLTQLSPGSYTLTVSDQNGCSFVETYTITEPSPVTLDLGPNLTVAAQDSVSINSTTNIATGAIGSVEWNGINGLQCSGCTSIEFIATITGIIHAIITDTAGCIATDSIKLTVTMPGNIYIPNIFSPNEDGVNDVFSISISPGIEIHAMSGSIFDRWGNLVFRSEEKPFRWNGTFKNKSLLPGVYVYKVLITYNLNGIERIEMLQGDITLIK